MRLVDGGFRQVMGEQDGGLPSANELPFIEVQVTTSLLGSNIVWSRLTKNVTVSNGMLLLDEPAGVLGPRRFYRVIER